MRRDASDVLLGQREHLGNERREVVLGQVVQRELHGGPPDLLARSRSCGDSRGSAPRGRFRAPRGSRAARRESPAARRCASRTASAVASDCTLACRTNGPGAAPELEAGARAVGVALLLAQVHVDAADELPAEDHVQHEQRVVVRRRCAARRRARSAAPTAPRPAGSRQPGDRSPAARCAAANPTPSTSLGPVGRLPLAERVVDQRGELLVRPIADRDDRHR